MNKSMQACLTPASKIVDWYFTKRTLPYWGILFLDFCCITFSSYVADYMVDGGQSIVANFWQLTLGILAADVVFVICFRLFRTYTGIARFSSFVDLVRVCEANMVASASVLVLSEITQYMGIHGIVYPSFREICLVFLIGTMLMWLERVAVKSMYDTFRISAYTKRAFVYGVNEGGVSIAKNLQNESPLQYKVVGFVSPDKVSKYKTLMGSRVYLDDENLVSHIVDMHAEVLIVSPLQTDHFRSRQDLINSLLDSDIRILVMPQAEEWDGKTDIHASQLREVEVDELLPREKIHVDMESIGKMLKGRRILVTGAAGSIGSEMARQIARFLPSDLILVDQAETPMHDLRLWMDAFQEEMREKGETVPEITTLVGSITNESHMEQVFSEHRPEYVFHAAAYKHVPMMEDNPAMAVQNNVYGTRVVADLAVKYGVRKFVMISTDKAVNPTNVMGCSKRICEIYCQSLSSHQSVTQFITTRFGNVLGSNGSVIPLFREQIAKGGPVTVTHPDIIRFFMLIPEACRLVLEAGTMGHGGEIFVFDMGEPVRIVDLARRMIHLSGAKDVEIAFTGLRDGEKLYEEVLNEKEHTLPTVHPKIKIAKVREYPYDEALRNEKELLEISKSYDAMRIVGKMKEMVPEYVSQNSIYSTLDSAVEATK